MASIRRIERKNGKIAWQINFMEPREDGSRKRKRLCYDTKKEAEDELAKRVSLTAEGKYLVERRKELTFTLGDLCKKYQQVFANQASMKTTKRYYLEKFKKHWGDDTRLAYITYYELEKYRNDLQATPIRQGKPRTVRAVNVEMSVLRHMFVKARSWGLVAHNPFNDGESLKLKGENVRNRFLDENEIRALLQATGHVPKNRKEPAALHLRPIIEAAIHLGTRAGKEILGLKWDDVDFESQRIRVTRGKTGRVDYVPMNEDLRSLFRDLRLKSASSKGHVFTYKGKPVRSVRRAFKTACEKAGIEDFRFHDLRHTCASHLIMRGASLKEVQEHLGHTNIATTNRYLHLTEEAKKETASRLSGITSIVRGERDSGRLAANS